jgi:PilZ domain
MKNNIQDRRGGERYVISFPIRVRWKGDDGKEVVQDGLTDNIGPYGTLVYLPRHLPNVGSKVNLTVTENPKDEVTVTAEVIRLERNAAHPQAALQLTDSMRAWKKKVWEAARAVIAAQEPEEFDDW